MSGTKRTYALILTICLLMATSGFIACSQRASAPAEALASPDSDDGHGLHTVNNARLREIMNGLSSLEMEKLHADAEGGKKTDARVEQVAKSAAALAADARVMPAAFKEMEMEAESRRVFDKLASKLQIQCRDLEYLANRRKTREMKAKMNEITQTCNECHASFRGPQMAMGKP